MTEDLRYPIGEFEPKPFSLGLKNRWLLDIQMLPSDLEQAIHNLDEAQLQTPYRPGGWTVQQVVHHVADSHMNAYMRFKLALTEDFPAIKPYDEKAWAMLDDVTTVPVNVSNTLLFALHERWVAAIKKTSEADWNNKKVFHPESKKEMSLWFLLGMYAWHGRHHTQQILSLRERMKW